VIPACHGDLPEASDAGPQPSSSGDRSDGPRDRGLCAWSQARDASLRQITGRATPAATVALPAAACALGMSHSEAAGLAARGAFPCSVVESGQGYRVPIAALMAVLGTRRLGGRPQRA
jgi:hypothetical protein